MLYIYIFVCACVLCCFIFSLPLARPFFFWRSDIFSCSQRIRLVDRPNRRRSTALKDLTVRTGVFFHGLHHQVIGDINSTRQEVSEDFQPVEIVKTELWYLDQDETGRGMEKFGRAARFCHHLIFYTFLSRGHVYDKNLFIRQWFIWFFTADSQHEMIAPKLSIFFVFFHPDWGAFSPGHHRLNTTSGCRQFGIVGRVFWVKTVLQSNMVKKVPHNNWHLTLKQVNRMNSYSNIFMVL